jgi:hypothetical protein
MEKPWLAAIDLFDCDRDTFFLWDRVLRRLCCELLLEHLRRDPMRMMSEIYGELRDGAMLVLTTPPSCRRVP